MKKHTKIALIVASCLSIGATFLMMHPSQAAFLNLPQQKKAADRISGLSKKKCLISKIKRMKRKIQPRIIRRKKNQKKNRCQKKTL